jgi:tRNA pseudouridine synthase 10
LVDAQQQKSALLKEYSLCRHCLARQAGGGISKKQAGKCYICRGLFGDLDSLAGKVLATAKPYQHETFLIGATLPTQLYEREDALRARLKIRGRESIKNQLTRELGMRISKKTKKKADYQRPDVTINLAINRDGEAEATARARPLVLEGRYVKKERGLPQKQDKCAMCLGKGCNLCDGTGLAGLDSVEGIIAKHLMEATGGQAPKFSWIGSEDKESLVLGKGRPFYVKISDPRVRRPKMKFRQSGVEAKIVSVLDNDDEPDTQARFTVRTRIAAKCERAVTTQDVKLLKSLAGAQVKFENRSKLAAKKIQSVQAKKAGDSELELVLTADGGLPIKQFVGGEEYMEPNVSKLLGAKCDCVTFDVLAVTFLFDNR